MGILSDIKDGVQSGIRIAQAAAVLGEEALSLLSGRIPPDSAEAAAMTRKSFEKLGATYIKLGQLIASAPGMFPDVWVREMQSCLDQVNPLPYATIESILHKEFQGREHEIFASIDPTPIASASIAQVHGAKLKNGADVVIKVQRPGIETILNADLNLLFVAAWLFEKIAPGGARTSLTGIVEDFHRTILEETDFYKEAGHIDEFREFLRQIQQEQVTAPRVYHEASTKKVLTMERFYGVPLTDLEAIRSRVKDPEETLVLALNTWFQSLVFCGFFHADVHAGNLMVLDDGRVGFIDFGIVGRMDPKIWSALMGLMESMGTGDYGLMARSLIEMNATSGKIDEAKFASDLETLFEGLSKAGEAFQSGEAIDEENLNELFIKMMDVARDNGLRFPREFALLFKQILYFDQYTRALAPGLNIATSDKITRSLPAQ